MSGPFLAHLVMRQMCAITLKLIPRTSPYPKRPKSLKVHSICRLGMAKSMPETPKEDPTPLLLNFLNLSRKLL